jgi:hypothetical protein
MAKPRVFISSTYFDLKSIREELDRFITTMGYESVRHDEGHISYGKDEAPEIYAYKEIEHADILISIIGSKYGSESTTNGYSISQQELKRAHTVGKQVYIFIDDAVNSEYQFYKTNKHLEGLHLSAVTDKRIYTFIEEIYALPHGNPIFPFKTGGDITNILREQWAGLFQQSLQTVDQMVKYLQKSQSESTAVLHDIVMTNHPIFNKLQSALNIRYRVYFTNFDELQELLKASRNFIFVSEPSDEYLDSYVWMKEIRRKLNTGFVTKYGVLTIKKSLFDNKKLIPVNQSDWHDEFIIYDVVDNKPRNFPDDDDIPF